MGLASGAHVKIDGVEYQLDGSLDTIFRRHYEHGLESLFLSGSQVVAGKPGAQNIRPDLLFFKWDDWSGGEGRKFWDEAEPLVYDSGLCNTRRRGYLSPPPPRTDANMPSAAGAQGFCDLANTSGDVWLSSWDKLWYGNGTYNNAPPWTNNWTEQSVGFVGSDRKSAMASDPTWIYIANYDSGTGNRGIRQVKPGTNRTFETRAVFASHHIAMAWIRGQLFTLDSDGRFASFDTTATPPVTGSVIGRVTDDASVWGARMCATDTGVMAMVQTKGVTHLYEITAGSNPTVRLATTMVNGFTGADICFSQGIVFIYGHHGPTKAALWMFPLDQRQEVFVDYIRYGTALVPQSIAAGLGAQVVMLNKDGSTFVYDVSTDSVSQLDDVIPGSYQGDDVITFNGARIRASEKTVSTFVPQVGAWDSDDQMSTTVDGTWIAPAWHFGVPFDDKIFGGVHLNFTPIPVSGNQTIAVDYQIDESGSWTSLATVTQATPGAQRGVVDLVASNSSNTIKGRNMRFRVTLHAGAQLLDFDIDNRLASYIEVWDLAIRVQDETPTITGQSSVRGRSWHSNKIRQSIYSSMRNRKIVSFVDGYEDPDYANNYTYDVLIENVRDIIMDSNTSDGVLFVTLRRVITDQK